MNANKTTPSLWPWAIIAYFVLALTFLVSFIVWSARQREDLVAENYYETEIRYQQQIDRLVQSKPFDELSIVTYDVAQQQIVINLPAVQSRSVTGRVHLYRPSDARLDRDVPLTVNREGGQRLDAKALCGGLWKVRVQWSIAGREYFCDRSVIVPG